MRVISAAEIAENCPFNELIAQLRTAFEQGAAAPVRQHLNIHDDGALLVMPCVSGAQSFGVKLASVFPENPAQGRPTIQGVYCLFSQNDGSVLAVLEAAELTARRTAATSALASQFLSREDSSVLGILGAGKLAPYFVEAHATVRPITKVVLWARDPEKAASTAQICLEQTSIQVETVSNIEAVTQEADILSTLTSASAPILFPRHLRPGMHLDLVGSHKPEMIEADPKCLAMARLYADETEAALAESGEMVAALAAQDIRPDDIILDLHGLTRSSAIGRASEDEITLFKSVGNALEDLVAAQVVVSKLNMAGSETL